MYYFFCFVGDNMRVGRRVSLIYLCSWVLNLTVREVKDE